jgi:hypothetical protein
MMIKLIKINQSEKKDGQNLITADLFADTRTEANTTTDVKGLSTNDVLQAGSTIFTATGDLAILNSDGVWNWL